MRRELLQRSSGDRGRSAPAPATRRSDGGGWTLHQPARDH
eukprot:gene12172-18119_t